jgi:hypothetical protein
MRRGQSSLRRGEIVEVLSKQEIMLTLDADGTLESVPFMPEMRKFCGKRFKVFKRADKICAEAPYFHMRQMKNAVSLENVRCDGQAHDGCKRMCAIFWKEAWLRKVGPHEPSDAPPEDFDLSSESEDEPIQHDRTYVCQSTALLAGTSKLSSLDPRQYFRDIRDGNFNFGQVLKYVYIYFFNRVQYKRGKPEYGQALGDTDKTPAISLNLQPGELVEVRSREEIIQTIDRRGTNRGLGIDQEMLQYCGKRFRVLTRVNRIILEATGKMREIQNTVALTDVICTGLCRRGCTRNSYPMWREAWLKRVDESNTLSAELSNSFP